MNRWRRWVAWIIVLGIILLFPQILVIFVHQIGRTTNYLAFINYEIELTKLYDAPGVTFWVTLLTAFTARYSWLAITSQKFSFPDKSAFIKIGAYILGFTVLCFSIDLLIYLGLFLLAYFAVNSYAISYIYAYFMLIFLVLEGILIYKLYTSWLSK